MIHYKNRETIKPSAGVSVSTSGKSIGFLTTKRNMFKMFISLAGVSYYVDPEITFVCPIDYRKYPFHVYTCKLRYTSFSEFNTSIQFKIGEFKN